jgi:hypothetical protein
MWERFVNELSTTMQEIAGSIGQFLPRLMVMLLVVVIGWLIAYVLKSIVRSILRFAKFDRISQDAGAAQFLKNAALPSSTELLSRFVFWVAWVGFMLAGINFLGIAGLEEQISNFFVFLPRLFVALFVLFFGLWAASFFSRAVLLAAVNADLPSPRLISFTIQTLIILFTISMACEAVGIAHRTVLVAFALILGSLMLGLALAFGLGGQDLARRYLERRLQHPKKEEREDELSPL